MKTGHWPWTFVHALEVCNLILWVWKYCTRAQNRRQTSVTRAAAQAQACPFRANPELSCAVPKSLWISCLTTPGSCTTILCKGNRAWIKPPGWWCDMVGQATQVLDRARPMIMRTSQYVFPSFLPLLPEDCWLHIHFQNSILLWQSREQSQLGRPKANMPISWCHVRRGAFPQKRFKSRVCEKKEFPQQKPPSRFNIDDFAMDGHVHDIFPKRPGPDPRGFWTIRLQPQRCAGWSWFRASEHGALRSGRATWRGWQWLCTGKPPQ